MLLTKDESWLLAVASNKIDMSELQRSNKTRSPENMQKMAERMNIHLLERRFIMLTQQNWFAEARFGMFIHWGLYSLAGGVWKGMDVPWVAEWLMHKYRIPIREYASLCEHFNPVGFHAEQWVLDLKSAGMKYLVITAKHHDGFAMFHSRYDRYNIVDATPFGRDPLQELAKACEKHQIRLGFYYSQDQDWHEPGASGNTWDFPEAQKKEHMFQEYLNNKVKFQLTELLTRYGDISILWFDTPVSISPEQSEDLKNFVHSLQKNCLVSGRIGNGKGDYESLGDNELPFCPPGRLCEGLGTMNESWGYKSIDHHYRSSTELLRILCQMAVHNSNYLLNVGPDANGCFPRPAKDRLKKIGAFLRKNGEALYGSQNVSIIRPFQFQWGNLTQKGNFLYFWIFKKYGSALDFYGLRNQHVRADILDGNIPVETEEIHRENFDYHKLTLSFPAGIRVPFVVRVDCGSPVDCNPDAYRAGWNAMTHKNRR